MGRVERVVEADGVGRGSGGGVVAGVWVVDGMSEALSKKEAAFVNEYFLCGMRPSEAARRLGSKQPWNYAYRMMRNDEVLAEIQRRFKEKHISADEVIGRLSDMATSNMSDFAYVQSASDLADLENGYLIKKFKRKITRPKNGDPFEEIELELYPADVNLERVGKAHGLFSNDAGSSEDKPLYLHLSGLDGIIKKAWGTEDEA